MTDSLPGAVSPVVSPAVAVVTSDPDSAGARLAVSLTGCERRIVNALRHRPHGTTVQEVAALSEVSLSHARRCLAKLREHGVATSERRSCRWGYGDVELTIWQLTYMGTCAEMIGFLPMEETAEIPTRYPDMVPPQFWSVFWFTPAQNLRISQHGLLIAQTLLSGPDAAAALWALVTLPVETLEECRRLRGCDTGEIAAKLDTFISARRGCD
ncbi:MAG: winged helix-turn-helix domain-containing protein [Acidimicrobiaceae bacterium]|nr:winged helix-turn-helix domain-containing protein [Acidimicrobiaceae bacterium]MCY4279279.1 winged helix-turn-helix domain-containing protein [Acidimicrobiaceae bacterium]MCY4294651.1 winged helix-turn-helix domain-containing protein [Acidimicrobiaceae bacterium]